MTQAPRTLCTTSTWRRSTRWTEAPRSPHNRSDEVRFVVWLEGKCHATTATGGDPGFGAAHRGTELGWGFSRCQPARLRQHPAATAGKPSELGVRGDQHQRV